MHPPALGKTKYAPDFVPSAERTDVVLHPRRGRLGAALDLDLTVTEHSRPDAMLRILHITLLLVLLSGPALGARRPAAADFAPDRWRFKTLEAGGIGRELPFVYDVPTAAKQAANDPRTTYETWIGLGLQAYREEDHRIAASCLRAALTLSNNAPLAVRHLLARSQLFDDQTTEAEETWRDICARDATDAEARWQLGFCLFLRDDLDSAMEQWSTLDSLAPEHPLPPLMLGLVHWSLLQYGAAQRNLIAATRRPQAPPNSFLALAAIATHQGDLPEAAGWLRRGFDRIPAAEQQRWYALPHFAKLRTAGGPLVADLVREFKLDAAPALSLGTGARSDNVNIEVDRPYATSLGLSRLGSGSATNSPDEGDAPIRLRLGPKIETHF